jgi:glutamate racemase
VALAEEGWTEGPVAVAAAERYLGALRGAADTLVLGCTHFPLLQPVIASTLGSGTRIVDSAVTTAAAVHAELEQRGLLRARAGGAGATAAAATTAFLATDGVARFAAVGGRFLGEPLLAADIELIDL